MSDICNENYDPELVGRMVLNSRGKMVLVRKYHLTEEELKKAKEKFQQLTKDIPQNIKDKAGPKFFNPYRSRGVYYAQIQALYLLGANEWHSYNDVRNKMKQFASTVEIIRRKNGCVRKTNVWAEFEKKISKPDTVTSKDLFGRINENMIFFQRLTKYHPYGYKLKQACAAVDIKRVSKEGFSNGVFYYRLSTYKTSEESIPVKDSTEFVSSNERGRKYGSKNRYNKSPLIVKKYIANSNLKQLKREIV